MSDTVTVTIQTGKGTASAQTFDFNSDDAAPKPPSMAGDIEMDAETDTGSAPRPPVVDEDDASSIELSNSEAPSPPGFDEDMSGDEEDTYDDSGAASPPAV